MNHTTCLLCKKEVSRPCLGKHFLSRQHLEHQVKPALLSADKYELSAWRKSTTKSSCPFITVGDKMIMMCFGCDTVKGYIPSHHLTECPGAEKHITTLKQLIGSGDPDDLEPADELAKLHKRFKTVNKELEDLHELSGQLSDTQDSLVELIKEMADTFNDEERETWLNKLNEIRYD